MINFFKVLVKTNYRSNTCIKHLNKWDCLFQIANVLVSSSSSLFLEECFFPFLFPFIYFVVQHFILFDK